MLKFWEVTYQIGTNHARIGTCITEGDQSTAELDRDLQTMLAIKNSVNPEEIRLVKVLRKS